jgi:RND family efflux transporter MFP subunit
MNDGKTPLIETSTGPTKPRGGRKALVLIALASAGFAAVLGAKITAAIGDRSAVEKEQSASIARAKTEATRPPTVEVVRGKPATWEAQVSFEGTLMARQDADLGFKAGGRLATVRARVGDKVRRGQVLATLVADEAAAQVAAAAAQVAAAEAQAALAEDAEKRTASVVATGAQSEAAGVQAEKQRQLAAAQRDAARAQAALARTTLANHTLVAPFAGTVTRAPSAPGAVVGPGMPLFHVADLSTLKLSGAIRADDAALVRVGLPVEIHGDDGRAVAGRGKLTAVVPALDQATKRVPVEATVANEGDAPLLAGALVRASVRSAKPVAVLSFPHTVLRPGSQDEVVLVSGGKLEVRKVAHVVGADGAILVRSGVAPTDDLLLRPWAEATNGQSVTVSTAAAQGEGP